MPIVTDLLSLSPTAFLTFYTLDYTNLPNGSVLNFHSGTSEINEPVVWQGVTYTPMPIEAEGFDVTSKGAMPRPKLRVSNINGILSPAVKEFDDFVGCKVIRRRTLLKYMDSVNFPYDWTPPSSWGTFSAPVSTNPPYYSAPNYQYWNKTWSSSPALFTSVVLGTPQLALGRVPYFTPDLWKEAVGTGAHELVSQAGAPRLTVNNSDPGLRWVEFSVKYKHSGRAKVRLFNRVIRYDLNNSILVSADFDAATGVALSNSGASESFISPEDALGYRKLTLRYRLESYRGSDVLGLRMLDNGGNATFAGTGANAAYIAEPLLQIDGVTYQNATMYEYYEEPESERNPFADPNQHLPDDFWFVERKLTENKQLIEFELSSAFDLMGQQLPNRQIIQNSCPWKYRGSDCGWTGGYFDANNVPTTQANDICSKTLTACRVRFGNQNLPVRFGGFPGAVRGIN